MLWGLWVGTLVKMAILTGLLLRCLLLPLVCCLLLPHALLPTAVLCCLLLPLALVPAPAVRLL